MSNKDIIAKIKAEIEGLKSIEYPCDNSQQATGFFNALDRMTDFLDTLESEKPMQEGLEEEIKSWIPPIKVQVDEDVRGIMKHIREWGELVARHFAEWGYLRAAEKYNEIEYNRQRTEESVPTDLEEAAKDYTDSSEWLIGENLEHIDDAFIAGAKWQAEQLLKSSPLPEDTVLFNKGVEEGRRLAEEEQADLFTIVALDAAQRAKEQMMKEAVEGEITKDNRGNNVVRTGVFNNGFEIGDKVCIIIVKE